MAFFDSNVSAFTIVDGTGTATRDISAYVHSLEGLPGDRELNDVTAFGDTGRKHAISLENVKFTMEGFYENTASSGADVVLVGLRTATSSKVFAYGPEGTASGKRKYTGVCWMSDYKLTSKVGNMIAFKAEFSVDGLTTSTLF